MQVYPLDCYWISTGRQYTRRRTYNLVNFHQGYFWEVAVSDYFQGLKRFTNWKIKKKRRTLKWRISVVGQCHSLEKLFYTWVSKTMRIRIISTVQGLGKGIPNCNLCDCKASVRKACSLRFNNCVMRSNLYVWSAYKLPLAHCFCNAASSSYMRSMKWFPYNMWL